MDRLEKSRNSIITFIEFCCILHVTPRIRSQLRHLGLDMGMFYARDYHKGGYYLGCMWLLDRMAKASPIPPMPCVHVLLMRVHKGYLGHTSLIASGENWTKLCP